MRRNHDRCVLEDALQRDRIVDKHVSGRRAHERLYAAGFADLECLDFLDIAVRGTEIEAVIAGASIRRHGVLFGQCRTCRRLRIDVRHVHEAGDSAGSRRRRLAGEVAFVGKTRLAKMNLVVDHAWQEELSGRVYDLDAVGGFDSGRDLADSITLDENVCITDLTFIYKAGIANQ